MRGGKFNGSVLAGGGEGGGRWHAWGLCRISDYMLAHVEERGVCFSLRIMRRSSCRNGQRVSECERERERESKPAPFCQLIEYDKFFDNSLSNI